MCANENHKPKLLDRVREAVRIRHYSIRTERAYVDWVRRYILFHRKKHPSSLQARHVGEFLSHLAQKRNVAASTQNQALCAIVFLYRNVLEMELGEISNLVFAKKPHRLPEVFSKDEVRLVLQQMKGLAEARRHAHVRVRVALGRVCQSARRGS